MSTTQTVVIATAVGVAAIAGYRYYQRKRAERFVKEALGGFEKMFDDMEKEMKQPGWAGFGNFRPGSV
jgi:predicted negative regulator of RcsB-dependent stress response